MSIRVISLLTLIATLALSQTLPTTLTSPNNNISVELTLAEKGRLTWHLSYKGNQNLMAPSGLGLTTSDDINLAENCTDLAISPTTTTNQKWHNPFGERSEVVDHYNTATISFVNEPSSIRVQLECRLYNSGFAFRYLFPEQEQKQLTFKRENTEFHFNADHRAWPVYHAQGIYKPEKISTLKPGAERPLTIEVVQGPTLAIGEAGLFTFARMKFEPLANKPHALVSRLDGTANLPLPGATPWRYIMIADNPARLLEQNDLLLNLNEPSKIADTSWIKPGKVIRETSLTTTGGKACVDFCKTMNLQYVEFDAGWYGHEYDDAADARAVNLDPKRSKGPLDLPEVIRYAKANNIGVLLYVNRRELERRLDELLPIYKEWGIAGLKYGFVNVGSQKWTTWLHEAIAKAGTAGFMIDIHDEYRLTGNQRTWPNVMTVEGIAGNEEMPEAPHNCALPFTRYLCGAGDYTPCWYNGRVKNTRAHQLAMAAVYFSPWQFLFWYDNPGMFRNEPELEFWRKIPTVWDDTRVINAEIGNFATIARRTKDEWFVGTINAHTQRLLTIPLDFLPANANFTAHIYSDAAPDGSNRTAVKCETRTVTSSDIIMAEMAANGGHAIHLVCE